LPESSGKRQFGLLALGNDVDSLFSLVLETKRNGSQLLFIDKNNNEDLSDDENEEWTETKSFLTKEELIEVTYLEDGEEHIVPYPVVFYKYKNKLPDVIAAYRNGYRKGAITLEETSLKMAIFDDDLNGLFHERDRGVMVVDLNGDGVLDGSTDSEEYLALGAMFNYLGKAYTVHNVSSSGNKVTLAERKIQNFPNKILKIEQRAPAFRSQAIDGRIVDISNYKNKVVLVDFWATWCKPWERGLAERKNLYQRYNSRGFEIIGISLDYDLTHLQNYLSTNKIKWPQLADGNGWDMPLFNLYRLKSLPKSFLLDRNGIIRYRDLQGAQLQAKVRELLNEPEIVAQDVR